MGIELIRHQQHSKKCIGPKVGRSVEIGAEMNSIAIPHADIERGIHLRTHIICKIVGRYHSRSQANAEFLPFAT